VIDHVSLEVSDLERSARFYDALFFALGMRRLFASDQAIAYGVDHPSFRIVRNGAAGPGNGHVAFAARGKAAVDGAYEAGLANGGSDSGSPGSRPQYGLRHYAAYLRDPDGLRVEVVTGSSSWLDQGR
jgi:catechol 2,3-dioxygenase-like lactoylglutathione lyase family enzyme